MDKYAHVIVRVSPEHVASEVYKDLKNLWHQDYPGLDVCWGNADMAVSSACPFTVEYPSESAGKMSTLVSSDFSDTSPRVAIADLKKKYESLRSEPV